jgi:hypothetical protein
MEDPRSRCEASATVRSEFVLPLEATMLFYFQSRCSRSFEEVSSVAYSWAEQAHHRFSTSTFIWQKLNNS